MFSNGTRQQAKAHKSATDWLNNNNDKRSFVYGNPDRNLVEMLFINIKTDKLKLFSRRRDKIPQETFDRSCCV